MSEHEAEGANIDGAREANPQAATLELDHSGRCRRNLARRSVCLGPSLRWGFILKPERHENLTVRRRLPHCGPAPCLQEAAIDLRPTRQVRDVDPRPHALGHQCRFLCRRPTTSTRRPRDQLDTTISATIVPVLMRGIITGIIHPAARKLPTSRPHLRQ
jgi:hypothetical protein